MCVTYYKQSNFRRRMLYNHERTEQIYNMKKIAKANKQDNRLRRDQRLSGNLGLPQEDQWMRLGTLRRSVEIEYPPIGEIRKEVNNLSELAEYKVEVELKIEEFTATIEAQQAYVESEKKNLESEQRKNKKLSSELLNSQKRITKLSNEIEGLQEELCDKRSRNSQLEAESAEKTVITEQLNAKQETLENLNSKLTEQNGKLLIVNKILASFLAILVLVVISMLVVKRKRKH